MSLKIDASQSATAHHIVDGAVLFPYAIDARQAISNHPKEWSADPWPAADTMAARALAGHDGDLTPEEQAAIDEHAKAVAEANERLQAVRERLAAEAAEREQIAQDEATVASVPPIPAVKPLTNAQKRKAAQAGE